MASPTHGPVGQLIGPYRPLHINSSAAGTSIFGSSGTASSSQSTQGNIGGILRSVTVNNISSSGSALLLLWGDGGSSSSPNVASIQTAALPSPVTITYDLGFSTFLSYAIVPSSSTPDITISYETGWS